MDNEQTTATRGSEICEALYLFATGAMALAAALEGAQKIGIPDATAPPTEDAPVTYQSRVPLGKSSVHKRRKAMSRAATHGFDLKHWAHTVRRLRVTEIGTNAPQFAEMVGVSEGCVHNWEAGTAFATVGNRERLESLARGVCGWSSREWQRQQNGEVTA